MSCDIIILRSSSAFNLELDFMLDKFDSDGEEPNPALNDVDHIAHKYYTKSKSPYCIIFSFSFPPPSLPPLPYIRTSQKLFDQIITKSAHKPRSRTKTYYKCYQPCQ